MASTDRTSDLCTHYNTNKGFMEKVEKRRYLLFLKLQSCNTKTRVRNLHSSSVDGVFHSDVVVDRFMVLTT